jgi:hypothetical protein
MAAGLLCTASLAMGAEYALKETEPETGSNIYRTAMTWPVPIDKTYAELSKEEKDVVRSGYVTLGPNDEPPYPAYGMTGVLQDMSKIRLSSTDDGMILMAVSVDASGQPRGVAVLRAADVGVAKAFAFVLMHTAYKPAMCAGAPCAGEYAFRYDFSHRKPNNFIVNWDPYLWSDKVAKQP